LNPARWAQWLAGMWAGALACIALMAAPAAFAVLPPAEAGRLAGRLFAQEAYVGLLLVVLLYAIERHRARADAAAGRGSVLSANMLLLMGVLFCTVAGYFAVQPMMAAARAGQGGWSFAALHGLSAGFFGLKTLLVAALAWRLAGR
jgi:hypothetical protein